MTNRSLEIVENWLEVSKLVQRALKDVGRDPAGVSLVCVSKTYDASLIEPLLSRGHREFGENRVQEAAGKWPHLRALFPDVKLHLIGPLQSNKTREAVALFDVIETLDRIKLAAALATEYAARGKLPELFIQVNTGAEKQKAGVLPQDADAFIQECLRSYQLPVVGLMCIPPVGEQASPHFAFLARIAKRNGLSKLSMGMSLDYELAIQLGATHVRVGSAIFGERVKH